MMENRKQSKKKFQVIEITKCIKIRRKKLQKKNISDIKIQIQQNRALTFEILRGPRAKLLIKAGPFWEKAIFLPAESARLLRVS